MNRSGEAMFLGCIKAWLRDVTCPGISWSKICRGTSIKTWILSSTNWIGSRTSILILRTGKGAESGVKFHNTSETEPLVCLRYFGPDANPDAPEVGAYKSGRRAE